MTKQNMGAIILASVIVLLGFGTICYLERFKTTSQEKKNYIELKKDTVIKKGVKGGEGIKKYSWVLKKGSRIYFVK